MASWGIPYDHLTEEGKTQLWFIAEVYDGFAQYAGTRARVARFQELFARRSPGATQHYLQRRSSPSPATAWVGGLGAGPRLPGSIPTPCGVRAPVRPLPCACAAGRGRRLWAVAAAEGARAFSLPRAGSRSRAGAEAAAAVVVTEVAAAEAARGEGREGGWLWGMDRVLRPQWKELALELERRRWRRRRLLLPSPPLFLKGLYTLEVLEEE
ncbi:uncharacterized protein [Macaca fascicularis]|uniref:uncharacterized protein n=1 Tax=Macaca fascicularis TaxID=9541 RepID=UPI003D159C7A